MAPTQNRPGTTPHGSRQRSIARATLLVLLAAATAGAGDRVQRRAPPRPGTAQPGQAAPLPEFSPEQYASLADCPFEPGCPAMILLDETQLDNTFERARFLHRRVTKLFTQRGVDEYADLTLRSISAYWMIARPTGRTVLPDGKVVPLPDENVFVKPFLRANGRDWVESTTVKFPGVVPGAIVDATWSEVSTYAASVAGFSWEVQRDLPVLRSVLRLKRGNVPFAGMDRGLSRFKVAFTEARGEARFVASNVPSLAHEPDAPPADILRFGVYFYLPGLEKDWMGEVAGVAAGAAGAFIEKCPEVATRVAALTAPDDPPLKRVEKIYRFVQEEMATGEQRPDSSPEERSRKNARADDVLKRGYGSEKERTFLFLAMAKAAGLDVSLLVVAERDNAILDTKLPDPDQFSAFAAAVRIGADWIYLDPGTKHCPFGMVAPDKEHVGANALLVKPRRGAGATREVTLNDFVFTRNEVEPYRLVSIPVSSAERNVVEREAVVTLKPDGSAGVEVTETGTGLVDLDRHREFEPLSDEDRRAAIERRLARMHAHARLEELAFEDLSSFEKPATLRYRFTLDGLSSNLGDQLVLSPSLFEGWGPRVFASESRTASVVIPHTRKTRERIVIRVPVGYEARELPERMVLSEGPLMLASYFSREMDAIVLSRLETIDTVVWSAADYPRLRRFLLDAREVDQRPLVLARIDR